MALIAAGGAIKFSGDTGSPEAPFQRSIETILVQSGFHVTLSSQSWNNGEIVGATSFVARHGECREPIIVTPTGLMTPLEESVDSSLWYVYGPVQEHSPSRLSLVRELAWLELRWALSFGRTLRPPRTMLRVVDPSACLSLTSPQWPLIWRGRSS